MYENIDHFAVVTGKGTSPISQLNAVDNAMIEAGIGNLNLIKVSSLLPKGIEKVEDFDMDFGSLVPSVLSIAAGEEKTLMAGISFGFNEEGSGYVTEHRKKDYEIETDAFIDESEKKLFGMAEKREKEIDDFDTHYIKLEGNDRYGCALAGLVYLP